jgi:hypothetical protein
MSFLNDLFWNYYQELGWVISGVIRYSGRAASNITHYRKHFLGTLVGAFEAIWLGYEN